ncbi:MAG: glycoside hydrolase family 127 protein [Clostridia bacterium]|nr:glycoside hydrolase family 127 protein [Clostridia bacterium]
MGSNIEVSGFLKQFLKTQMDGLTGHIEEAGYPFNCVEWGQPDHSPETKNSTWWRYEQVSYWMDGYTRCAILLGDEKHIANAKRIIYNVIHHPDGTYLGPVLLKEPDEGWHRWPHVVFFRACMAMYDYTGDEAIPKAMEAHYLNDPVDYGRNRDVMNVEIMLWVYGITKNKELLRLAQEAYDRYNQHCERDACDRVALSQNKPHEHGVTYNEYSKLGAILYRATGKEEYLRASVNAFDKANRMFMLPGGCVCSDEYMESNHYYRSTETCDISDMTWSLAYLLRITKNPKYGDWIERCVFNAGIGATTEDFRALQYFSSANQVICDGQSNHNDYVKGSGWMQFAPNPGTECCPGNVNRFMPNYVLNMWGAEEDRVYCYTYGAGTFTCEIGGKKVSIRETTNYPVIETVTFDIETEVPFTLYYRFPSFMKNCRVSVDGKRVRRGKKSEFNGLSIDKSCRVEIIFESDVVAHTKKDQVYFTKGALTYSLGMIGERIAEYEEGKTFPKYRMYANEPWNYAVKNCEPFYTPCDRFEGFDLTKPLPYLTVKAVKISNYRLQTLYRFKMCVDSKSHKMRPVEGKHVFTPRLVPHSKLKLEQDVEEIKLYPYGAGKLRMTVFSLVD